MGVKTRYQWENNRCSHCRRQTRNIADTDPSPNFTFNEYYWDKSSTDHGFRIILSFFFILWSGRTLWVQIVPRSSLLFSLSGWYIKYQFHTLMDLIECLSLYPKFSLEPSVEKYLKGGELAVTLAVQVK